jgi:hypothetical protein
MDEFLCHHGLVGRGLNGTDVRRHNARGGRRPSADVARGSRRLQHADRRAFLRRTRRQNAYEPEFEDWLWYAALPLIGYFALVASAIGIGAIPVYALFAAAGAVLLLILVGIHNAWDVVTYIAIEQPAGSGVAPLGAGVSSGEPNVGAARSNVEGAASGALKANS